MQYFAHMKPQEPSKYDSFDDPLADVEETLEGDLWFLPVAFGSRFQLKRLAET
jgi:hypothetical protein